MRGKTIGLNRAAYALIPCLDKNPLSEAECEEWIWGDPLGFGTVVEDSLVAQVIIFTALYCTVLYSTVLYCILSP